MELVFQISDSPVRPPVFQKVDGGLIRIGRAFDNDLILNDATISPHHAEISIDEDGKIWLLDMDSLNGSWVDRTQSNKQKIELHSGSELTLGKTILHVFTPEHPVESAVKITPVSFVTSWIENPFLLVSSIILIAFLYGVEQWLNMFQEFKWQEIINVELIIFGSALSMGIFWAIVGRIFKHESNFKNQMKIIFVFIVAQFFITKFVDIILFNSLNYTFAMVLMMAVEFVLIALLLWLNLLLSTNQTQEQRLRTAVVVSAALVVLSIYSDMINESEFSDSPEYVKLLHPPALRITDGVDEQQFVTEISVVFDKLDIE